MLNKKIAVLMFAAFAVICMVAAKEEGPHDMADALRLLQELDRYYSNVGRPRIDRRDAVEIGDPVDPVIFDRALRLLVLHNLDQTYSYNTRPRYGKRSESAANWAKDLEKPDLPAWLAFVRRR